MSKRPLCFRARPTTFVFSISSLRGLSSIHRGMQYDATSFGCRPARQTSLKTAFRLFETPRGAVNWRLVARETNPSNQAQWIPLLLGMQTPQPAASLVQLASKLASNLCRENLSPAKGHLKSCCWVLVAHAAGENVPCFLQGIHEPLIEIEDFLKLFVAYILMKGNATRLCALQGKPMPWLSWSNTKKANRWQNMFFRSSILSSWFWTKPCWRSINHTEIALRSSSPPQNAWTFCNCYPTETDRTVLDGSLARLRRWDSDIILHCHIIDGIALWEKQQMSSLNTQICHSRWHTVASLLAESSLPHSFLMWG